MSYVGINSLDTQVDNEVFEILEKVKNHENNHLPRYYLPLLLPSFSFVDCITILKIHKKIENIDIKSENMHNLNWSYTGYINREIFLM